MDAVLRAAAIYAALLILFRVSGRRSLAQMTPFDLVLLLIIGEATQQALLGEDFSITHALLVIITLLLLDIGLSLIKSRWPRSAIWLEGVPTALVTDGRIQHTELCKARLTESDVLEAARREQGLERIDQIKLAVLEVGGGISIVPRR